MDILKTSVERFLWGLLKHILKKTFSSNYVQDIYFRELKKTGPNILSRSGICSLQGRIQDFKLGGAHLKNCAEQREARNVWGYFVWKITILRQKIIFYSYCGGRREICWGISCEKSRFYAKKIMIFSNFRGGGGAGCATPWIRPCKGPKQDSQIG